MPRQKPAEKVETLAKQHAALTAALTAARKEAKQKTLAEAKRRHEIAGAAVLAELHDNPDGEAASTLRTLLIARVRRPSERALLGLDTAKAAESTKTPQSEAAE